MGGNHNQLIPPPAPSDTDDVKLITLLNNDPER
jgi:hypothetical protein